jgi:hypothetical protein
MLQGKELFSCIEMRKENLYQLRGYSSLLDRELETVRETRF